MADMNTHASPSSEKEAAPLLQNHGNELSDGELSIADDSAWKSVSHKTTVDLVDEFFPHEKLSSEAEQALLGSTLYSVVVITIVVNAIEIGVRLQFPRDGNPVSNIYFWFELIFMTVYCAEAYVKLKELGAKEYFTTGISNATDFAITVFAVVQIFQDAFNDTELQGVGGTALRVLGLVRLLRIFRLMRVLTSVKDLAVTIGGLSKSVKPLAWIILVLFMFCYMAAVYFITVLKVTDHPSMASDSWGSIGSAIQAMISVVVVDSWTDIFDAPEGSEGEPMDDASMFMLIYLPFYVFALLVVFGISNIIIGVIVDATNETKSRLEWDDVREELILLGQEWEHQIHKQGLSRQHIMELTEEERGPKVQARREAAHYIMKDLIKRKPGIFPPGITPEELRMVCDVSGDGHVSHHDFVQSLSQILLCSNTQTRVLNLVNQGRTRRIANKSLDKIVAIESRLDQIVATIEELKGSRGHHLTQSPQARQTEAIESRLDQIVATLQELKGSRDHHPPQSLQARQEHGPPSAGTGTGGCFGLGANNKY